MCFIPSLDLILEINSISGQFSGVGGNFMLHLRSFQSIFMFYSLANTWTKCYLDSVQSYCSENEYKFMYDYMKVAYQPVTDANHAIQCDVYSESLQGVGNETTTEGVQETTTTGFYF